MIPTSISAQQVMAAIRSLGLDPDQVYELKIDPKEIHVVVCHIPREPWSGLSVQSIPIADGSSVYASWFKRS